jgi:hypothetical protein
MVSIRRMERFTKTMRAHPCQSDVKWTPFVRQPEDRNKLQSTDWSWSQATRDMGSCASV